MISQKLIIKFNCKARISKNRNGKAVPKQIRNNPRANKMVSKNKEIDVFMVINQFLKKKITPFLIADINFSFSRIIKKMINLNIKERINIINR